MAQLVFICGVPRSGTTVMAQILNAHPSVCIGVERYKHRLIKHRDFSSDLFTKERFFDFRPGDTNATPDSPRWGRIYRVMKQKWDGATVIGDKIPDLYKVISEAREAFGPFKVIYMLRDIHGVASSWNRRAARPDDPWPDDSDFRKAVRTWNQANSIMLRWRKAFPDDTLVVPYEEFFSQDAGQYARLCRFLGIHPADTMTALYERKAEQYRTDLASRPPAEMDGQAEFIAEHADLDTCRALLAPSDRRFPPSTPRPTVRMMQRRDRIKIVKGVGTLVTVLLGFAGLSSYVMDGTALVYAVTPALCAFVVTVLAVKVLRR